MDLPSLQPYRMSVSFKVFLLTLVALGTISLGVSFQTEVSRAWINYLIGATLFLSLSLFGLFFTAVQHITSARWSVCLRRVLEVMALTLPVAGLLFLGVYYGKHHLYEWTHEHIMEADAILKGKEPWLNPRAFGGRLLIYFLVWCGSLLYLIRSSFKQDQTGDIQLTQKNKTISAPILVLFGLSVSFAGFDILMSLEPHWFSTIFGVYFFSGLFQAGLAMFYFLCLMLYRSGVLKEFVNVNHFHDIGRLLFGFSIFWAYIAFSQFILIWYADLPEETFFYIVRAQHGWGWISFLLLMLRFFCPFLILLPFGAKRSFKVMIFVCSLVLVGHWIDFLWIVQPTLRFVGAHEIVSPHIGWYEISSALGFVALFLLVVGFLMERIRMVPMKDPRLPGSIHYYHHG